MRRVVATCVVVAAGVVAGALATVALRPAPASPHAPALRPIGPIAREAAPMPYLVWVPRGLPAGFAADVAALREVGAVTVIAEDDAWLRRTWSDTGRVIDAPAAPYAIPIDTAAVDPATFAAFVPPADRPDVAALAAGQAILGATAAELRGLGPGGSVAFGDGTRIRIAAIVPDTMIGAAEMVVSRATGARIGIHTERYLLLHPRGSRTPSVDGLRERLRGLLPASLGINKAVQVRVPGQTPYLRAGDAVLPPVVIKTLFGEFAAKPGTVPGSIEVDPAWASAHLETARVPVLGRVTCNRGILPQLLAAMVRLRSLGLAHTVRSFHGCFVPRYIGWSDANMLSAHSWGIAFDLNLATNVRGSAPHQNRRLVAVLARFGFQWGGTWIVPDGNHFEYHRAV